MTEPDIIGPWWEPSEPATNMINLVHGLEWIAEIIREQDGGDPTTDTGWKSVELLDLWLDLIDLIDKARGRT